eukprot:1626443-Prorocentrum_lima.AAC.1
MCIRDRCYRKRVSTPAALLIARSPRLLTTLFVAGIVVSADGSQQAPFVCADMEEASCGVRM